MAAIKTAPKKLVQLIHIAKTQLGLDDETYRAVLEQVTGKTSTTQMTNPQKQAVLDRLKQSGFKVNPVAKTGVQQLADDEQSKLIRHLWLSLHTAGHVKNPSEQALAAFVERQTGVSALQFLSSDSADKVINRLRNWCKRVGIPREPLQVDADSTVPATKG